MEVPGGGLTANKGGGHGSSDPKYIGGLGGTQTSGGLTYNNGSSTISTYKGDFGIGGKGATASNGKINGGAGGYGWYGGGGGTTASMYYAGGGGGGSGFIIGRSTSTYPNGYLGGDAELITALEEAIIEGQAILTKGESTLTVPTMTLTIVEIGTKPISTFKYYNGTSFIDVQAKYYNGTEFVPCNAHRYNGTEFVKLGG